MRRVGISECMRVHVCVHVYVRVCGDRERERNYSLGKNYSLNLNLNEVRRPVSSYPKFTPLFPTPSVRT